MLKIRTRQHKAKHHISEDWKFAQKWRQSPKLEHTVLYLREKKIALNTIKKLDNFTANANYKSPFMIRISGLTSNPKCNFGHWSKMTLKSNSYLLTKLQNELTKNGHNFSKKCFKCIKNWSFQKMSKKNKCATKLNFFNEFSF